MRPSPTPPNFHTMTTTNACAVYLMMDCASGDFKIGVSKHPQKRVAQVQESYNVGTVQLIGYCWFQQSSAALYMESAFHRRFNYKRSLDRGGREWFTLTDGQAKGVLSWMAHVSAGKAYKVCNISTIIAVPASEVSSRQAYFFWVHSAFVAFVSLPFAALIFTSIGHPQGFRPGDTDWGSGGVAAALVGATVGAVSASRVKTTRKISQLYGTDGEQVSPDLPIPEFRSVGLLEEVSTTLPNYSLPPGSIMPARINPFD
jgi:predicted GIY-YIG superfamily endonuclease